MKEKWWWRREVRIGVFDRPSYSFNFEDMVVEKWVKIRVAYKILISKAGVDLI